LKGEDLSIEETQRHHLDITGVGSHLPLDQKVVQITPHYLQQDSVGAAAIV
jgi:hypothetical protein